MLKRPRTLADFNAAAEKLLRFQNATLWCVGACLLCVYTEEHKRPYS